MANHFRETAQSLRDAAEAAQPTAEQRENMRHAADVLCKLEQLKRDLISSEPDDEAESDRLCAEFMNLLALHRGS